MDTNWYLVESSEAWRQRRNKPPLPTRVPSRFDATNSIPLLHYIAYKVIFELRGWQSFSSRDEKWGIRRYIFDLIDTGRRKGMQLDTRGRGINQGFSTSLLLTSFLLWKIPVLSKSVSINNSCYFYKFSPQKGLKEGRNVPWYIIIYFLTHERDLSPIKIIKASVLFSNW